MRRRRGAPDGRQGRRPAAATERARSRARDGGGALPRSAGGADERRGCYPRGMRSSASGAERLDSCPRWRKRGIGWLGLALLACAGEDRPGAPPAACAEGETRPCAMGCTGTQTCSRGAFVGDCSCGSGASSGDGGGAGNGGASASGGSAGGGSGAAGAGASAGAGAGGTAASAGVGATAGTGGAAAQAGDGAAAGDGGASAAAGAGGTGGTAATGGSAGTGGVTYWNCGVQPSGVCDCTRCGTTASPECTRDPCAAPGDCCHMWLNGTKCHCEPAAVVAGQGYTCEQWIAGPGCALAPCTPAAQCPP